MSKSRSAYHLRSAEKSENSIILFEISPEDMYKSQKAQQIKLKRNNSSLNICAPKGILLFHS